MDQLLQVMAETDEEEVKPVSAPAYTTPAPPTTDPATPPQIVHEPEHVPQKTDSAEMAEPFLGLF
jgi:hypothetical protein